LQPNGCIMFDAACGCSVNRVGGSATSAGPAGARRVPTWGAISSDHPAGRHSRAPQRRVTPGLQGACRRSKSRGHSRTTPHAAGWPWQTLARCPAAPRRVVRCNHIGGRRPRLVGTTVTLSALSRSLRAHRAELRSATSRQVMVPFIRPPSARFAQRHRVKAHTRGMSAGGPRSGICMRPGAGMHVRGVALIASRPAAQKPLPR
jgi:hypothetical protein